MVYNALCPWVNEVSFGRSCAFRMSSLSARRGRWHPSTVRVYTIVNIKRILPFPSVYRDTDTYTALSPRTSLHKSISSGLGNWVTCHLPALPEQWDWLNSSGCLAVYTMVKVLPYLPCQKCPPSLSPAGFPEKGCSLDSAERTTVCRRLNQGLPDVSHLSPKAITSFCRRFSGFLLCLNKM